MSRRKTESEGKTEIQGKELKICVFPYVSHQWRTLTKDVFLIIAVEHGDNTEGPRRLEIQ